MMRGPLAKLSERLEKVYSGTANQKDLKYLLYSAHDIQLASLFIFLDFTDFEYLKIDFAS